MLPSSGCERGPRPFPPCAPDRGVRPLSLRSHPSPCGLPPGRSRAAGPPPCPRASRALTGGPAQTRSPRDESSVALPSGHCRPSLGGHGGSAGDRGARARMLRGTGSRRPGPVKASPQTRPAGRVGRGCGRPCLGRSGSRPWPTGHRVALFAGSPRIPFSEDAPGKQGTVTAPAEKEDERGKRKSQRAAAGRKRSRGSEP